MTSMTRIIGLALVACLGSTAPSWAVAQTLRDHKQINDGLVVIAAGHMIEDNCPTISPKLIKAFFFAKGLERMAKDAGFSDDEIEEFVEDKAEKKRVEGLAESYLVSKGLDPERVESYCEVGEYEIERNSQIGVLLQAK